MAGTTEHRETESLWKRAGAILLMVPLAWTAVAGALLPFLAEPRVLKVLGVLLFLTALLGIRHMLHWAGERPYAHPAASEPTGWTALGVLIVLLAFLVPINLLARELDGLRAGVVLVLGVALIASLYAWYTSSSKGGAIPPSTRPATSSQRLLHSLLPEQWGWVEPQRSTGCNCSG